MTHSTNNLTMPETECTHIANDLIEAVAFGFASDEERQLVLEHAATCAVCDAALQAASFAADVLPMTAPDIDLPDSVWAGIEARIADTAVPVAEQANISPLRSPASQPSASPSPWRLHWAVAAVLALLTLAGGIMLGRTVFDTESDAPAQTIAQVTVTDPSVGASGTVEYIADSGVLKLHMDDMPAAPEGFVYQVWVIDGETPVPVGVLDPQSSEFATVSDPNRFQTLAITLEEGPLGNDLPTTDPIVVADLTQLQGD